MNEFVDRFGMLLLGCFIGFALGYIVRYLQDIKEGVDQVKALETQHIHDHDHETPHTEEGFVALAVLKKLALPLVVVVTVWASFVSQSTSNKLEDKAHQDLIDRCQSGMDNRTVQRQTVDGVYNFAIGAIQRDNDAPPLSKAELRAYNAYIIRANNFRSDLYAKIKPSDQCKPYVTDDDVKPKLPQPTLVK